MSYRPYTTASAANKQIPASPPIHPATAKMISQATGWLLGGTSSDAYKEWIKPLPRAIYYRGDTSTLPHVPIFVNWASGHAVCASTPKFKMPIPTWFAAIMAGGSGVNQDRNMVIVDANSGDVWETWHATAPGTPSLDAVCSKSQWNATIANLYPADTVSHTGYDGPLNPSPASASKIHYAAGLLVPEDFTDLSPGSVIPHALRLALHGGSNGSPFPTHVLPARYGDGKVAGGIPYGARIQLDPSLDVANHASVLAKREPWRSALIKILRTLQVYGCFPDDRSFALGTGGLATCNPASVIQGTYNGKSGFKFPWDAAGYGWQYGGGIPYDLMAHFRVIDWTKWTGA